jgi:aspartyl-tRNA(Asn)/glutamyl-tRNA(Gln) amidotransferase subunit C
MAISVKDVEYLALLARVQLTPEELKRLTTELEEILAYVEKLKAARTEGVPPTSHVLTLTNVFREDRVEGSIPVDAALANAPDREGTFFKVPPILRAP